MASNGTNPLQKYTFLTTNFTKLFSIGDDDNNFNVNAIMQDDLE